jgi:hypothetical protein
VAHDLTPWAPAIAVGGVLVGIVVTFITGWLTRRQTSALSIAEQKAALRNDRREAIYTFIQAAERVRATAQTPTEDISTITSSVTLVRSYEREVRERRAEAEAELLFRQKCIDVVCRPDLRSAAGEYATQLILFLTGGARSLDRNEYVAADDAFFDLARKELYAPKVSD